MTVPNRLRRYSKVLAQLIAFYLLLTISAASKAHDSRPLVVAIIETAAGVFRVATAVPPSLDVTNVPTIAWPESCVQRGEGSRGAGRSGASVIVCPEGLTGRTIRIAYPFYNPAITTLFTLELADGTRRGAMLPPDELEWRVPVEPSRIEVARSYTALGIEHILSGIDHLLFVAGLVLLAGTGRRILLAVTGFTAAHSITLSLAALEWVHVPVAPIEGLIALSIVFLARELVISDTSSFGYRYPVVVSFVFGLLHGFGFAGALTEIGLPVSEVATGLIGFNLGVELGQIAYIAALLGIAYVWRKGARLSRSIAGPPGRPLVHNVGGYLLGLPATFWTIERTVTAFIV